MEAAEFSAEKARAEGRAFGAKARTLFQNYSKMPLLDKEHDIVVNKRKCIWILINVQICKKKKKKKKQSLIAQKLENSCLFFTYLSIWGLAMGCVRFDIFQSVQKQRLSSHSIWLFQ